MRTWEEQRDPNIASTPCFGRGCVPGFIRSDPGTHLMKKIISQIVAISGRYAMVSRDS